MARLVIFITFAVIKIEAMSDDELKKKLESMTCEFRSGPTPSGGAFMIGYFFDSEGKECPKCKAKYIHIIEYDRDGKPIHECKGEYRRCKESDGESEG